ncbi:MAG: aminotransferase class I/II-fold pyridoxal phosphate-dependent enzyme [bacterium]
MSVKKTIIEKASRLFQLPPDLESLIRPGHVRGIIHRQEVVDLMNLQWPRSEDLGTEEADWITAASTKEIAELKEALAAWYLSTHGVRLNPVHEVFLGGSISSIMLQMSLAFIERGDLAFVPELGLPLYRKVVSAAEGESVAYAVSAKDRWRPGFEKVSTRLGRVARLLFLNSPHNPTGFELSEKDFGDLVWTAARENILIVADTAYRNIRGRTGGVLLAVTGGKKVGVEVGSFAYNFGLPPLPFGYVVGHRDAISGLRATRSLIRDRFPRAFVKLADRALRQYPSEAVQQISEDCRQAGAAAVALRSTLGLEDVGYDTTPFVWTRVESGGRSTRAADVLFRRSRVLVGPGRAFGETGHGYLRLSLLAGSPAFAEATRRIGKRKGLLRLVDDDA